MQSGELSRLKNLKELGFGPSNPILHMPDEEISLHLVMKVCRFHISFWGRGGEEHKEKGRTRWEGIYQKFKLDEGDKETSS